MTGCHFRGICRSTSVSGLTCTLDSGILAFELVLCALGSHLRESNAISILWGEEGEVKTERWCTASTMQNEVCFFAY